ncbi:hypothetical protein ACWD4V_33400 [Streptomyces tsukubensis]
MKKQTLAAVALTAAAMFGLTACGDDGGSDKGSSSTGADADRMQQFADCLRKYGMDVPEKGDRGKEVVPASGSSAQIEAAQSACAKFAPPDSGEDVTEADYDRAVRKAECLREQGIKAKDPKSGTTMIAVEEGPGTTREKLVAAYTTCNEKVSGKKN